MEWHCSRCEFHSIKTLFHGVSLSFLHWRREASCTVCPKQCIKYVFNLYLSFYFHYYRGKPWHIQSCNHCVAVCWVYILRFQVLEIKYRTHRNQRKISRKPERLKGRQIMCLPFSQMLKEHKGKEWKRIYKQSSMCMSMYSMQYGHDSDGLIVAPDILRSLF